MNIDPDSNQYKQFSPSLKDILLSRQLLTETQYDESVKQADSEGQNIGEYLYKTGLIAHKPLQMAIATAHNIKLEFLNLANAKNPENLYQLEQQLDPQNGYQLIDNYGGLNAVYGSMPDVVPLPIPQAGFSENVGYKDTLQRQAFVTARDFRHLFMKKNQTALCHQAANLLGDQAPQLTAKHGLNLSQKVILLGLLSAIFVGLFTAPIASLYVVGIGLSLLFIIASTLKIYSLFLPRKQDTANSQAAQKLNAADLPVYSILVPLYKEARIIERLTNNLLNLDYPRSKLDIKLLFEHDDAETLAAAKALNLPECFEFLVIHESNPKTKPKAMNFALPFVKGEYVTIYDAEDKPQPDQLLKAVAKFRSSAPEIACLQASLEYENWDENWLSRHFFIEYATQFNRLLPCFESLRLPLPLGGTSNHFETDILREIYGWDAYNVTEDADLGIRLTLSGYRAAVLDSMTLEEANHRLIPWLQQRTRWLKGWLQTAIVHSRHPKHLLAKLGAWRYIGLTIIMLNMILAALLHPLTLVLPVILYYNFDYMSLMNSPWDMSLFVVSCAALLIGHGASLMANYQAIAEFKRWKLVLTLLTAHLYWLLISIAAYAAIIDYIRRPFYWAKTEHGMSKLIEVKINSQTN
ncbi:MAG: glycosyltransferase [Rhizobiales bacterium]|nr:glycosyltransferase [Hyphomicrobiales bacterium]NRB14371.1 glycosyltransferase [Hyphomicrobiales bacterium]